VVVTAIFAVVAVGYDDCVDGFDVVVLCCFDAAVGGYAGLDIVVLVFAAIFVVGTAVLVVAVGNDECADDFDIVVLAFVAAVSAVAAIFDVAVIVVVTAILLS
jgi:hypothetical protein